MKIRNLNAFRERMRLRSKRMLNAKIKSLDEASSFMAVNAKRLAPNKSGETISGIRKIKRSNDRYSVESTVPGSFKQNLWANQRAPYRRPKMWWNRRQPTLYGDGSHRITGTPRFFDRAAQLTQKKIKGIFVRNTKSALHFG